MLFNLILITLFTSTIGFIDYPTPTRLLDDFLKLVVDDGMFEDERQFTPGYNCSRKCDSKESKICYFRWVLEMYATMSGACGECASGNLEDCTRPQCVTANGRERSFMSVNRQLPGPPIEVCRNDLIVVDVVNEIDGSGATIHWHGMTQEKNLFMDGVPFITQCPIHSGSTFRYKFEASVEGTFFYHSHTGHQKANGIYGALIVRSGRADKHYDYDLSEHVVILSDWMNELTENSFPGLQNVSSLPQSLLINGKGRDKNNTYATPLTVFNVDEGKRYKFRLIGASSNVCPMRFQIEQHNFTIVATDSNDVKPFIADTLYITSGERFDIIVETNHKKKDSFTIRVTTVEPCTDLVEVFAVLNYHREGNFPDERKMFEGLNLNDEDFPSLIEVNSPFPTGFPINVLESLIFDKGLQKAKPDRTFHLSFLAPPMNDADIFSEKSKHKFLVVNQPDYQLNTIGAVNKISFIFPKVPLLSQYNEVDESIFCNETSHETNHCDDSGYCYCTHRLIAPEHAVLEFILTNSGDPMVHPFHLHGHQFAVVEVGYFDETFNEESLGQKTNKRLKISERNPVYKDTVIIPRNGFVRLLYRSRSASLLFFHCHYDFHLQIGMAGILQIGDLQDLPKPPQNFPQCRQYLPNITNSVESGPA